MAAVPKEEGAVEALIMPISLTLICNQLMKYLDNFSVAKIHLRAFLTMTMISLVTGDSVEDFLKWVKWVICKVCKVLGKWMEWVVANENNSSNSPIKANRKWDRETLSQDSVCKWASMTMMMTFSEVDLDEWVVVCKWTWWVVEVEWEVVHSNHFNQVVLVAWVEEWVNQ